LNILVLRYDYTVPIEVHFELGIKYILLLVSLIPALLTIILLDIEPQSIIETAFALSNGSSDLKLNSMMQSADYGQSGSNTSEIRVGKYPTLGFSNGNIDLISSS
jgi:hypothetical protein